MILGVTCNVIRDELTRNGNAVEATRDWCTLDKLGNVWYLGEFTAVRQVTSAQGSREAGVEGAIPDIFMLAQPPYRP